MLGFETSRPEKTYGKGPDLLWLISTEVGLIIEAKSRKMTANAMTKVQHGHSSCRRTGSRRPIRR